MIDTPGMRELGMIENSEGINETFPEIESLMKNGRFANCKHKIELGCAILEALEDGTKV